MSKHHLVPQFYLKNFKIPTSRSAVYIYYRGLGKDPEWRNTSTVAYRNNFYNFTNNNGTINKGLEPAFSVIESDVRPIIEEIISNELLPTDSESRYALTFFIATLLTRNTAYRNKLKTQQQAIMSTMLKHFPGIDKRKEFKGLFIEPNEDELLSHALSSALNVAPVIGEKNFYLLKSEEGRFVTSDNPVTIHHSSHKHSEIFGPGGVLESTLSLPLSPNYCLMMDHRSVTESVKVAEDTLIDEINWLTAIYAENNLFSDTKTDEIDKLFKNTHYGYGQAVEVSFAGETTIYKPEK